MGKQDKEPWKKYGMTKEKWEEVHDEAFRAELKATRLTDNLPENYMEYMAELTEPMPTHREYKRGKK